MPTSETPPILAAVDFSSLSATAAVFAARLANEAGAPLVLLHVVHESVHDCGRYRRQAPADHPLLPLPDIAARLAESFLNELRAREPDLKPLATARTRIVPGLPEGRIVEVSERIGAAVIVMGKARSEHRHSLFRRPLSDEIEQRAKVPVIAVPQSEETLPGTMTAAEARFSGALPEVWRKIAATYRAAFNV